GKEGRYAWDLINPNKLPAPALDADGYPIGLGSGQVVWTPTMVGIDGRYPGGTYTVLFDGTGEVEVDWDAARTRRSGSGGTTRFEVKVSPSKAGIAIRILKSSKSDPVRNVRMIMPGFEATYAAQPFHPEFLKRLAPFSTLRFTDWGAINDTLIVDWADRKLPTSRSQHRGVAFEYMADLANVLDKDAWVS